MLTLILLFACTPEGPTPAESLSWLVGDWEEVTGEAPRRMVTAERWHGTPDGTLLGQAHVRIGETLGFAEALTVTDVDGTLTYTAWPVGQDPIAFRATLVGPAEVAFSNPDHDFPQKIRYALEGDALRVTADGTGKEGARHEDWTLTRTAP